MHSCIKQGDPTGRCMYNIPEDIMNNCIVRKPSERFFTLELCADREYFFKLSIYNAAGGIAMTRTNFSKPLFPFKPSSVFWLLSVIVSCYNSVQLHLMCRVQW